MSEPVVGPNSGPSEHTHTNGHVPSDGSQLALPPNVII